MNLVNAIKQFARDEEGVTAIEYALLAAAIAVVVAAAATPISARLKVIFNLVIVALGGTAV